MSIEAMKQVIELYDEHCYNNDHGGIEFSKKHGYKFIEAIEALRTATQQAESEPVGAREALERIASWSEHPAMLGVDYGSNGVRDYYRKIARDALAHPAPGVPAGYALVPMTEDQRAALWLDSPVDASWATAEDAYKQGIQDAEAHHGITAQAKKEDA